MRRHNAFTLVELLVVIAIVSGLVTILLPALASARGQARRASCLSNLRQLAVATAAYASAHNRFPLTEALTDTDAGKHTQVGALFNATTVSLPEWFRCPDQDPSPTGAARDRGRAAYIFYPARLMRPPTATDLYTPATDAEAVFHPAALLHLFESSTPSYPLWHDIDRFHASAAARRALGSTSMADDGRGFNASYLDGSARSLR